MSRTSCNFLALKRALAFDPEGRYRCVPDLPNRVGWNVSSYLSVWPLPPWHSWAPRWPNRALASDHPDRTIWRGQPGRYPGTHPDRCHEDVAWPGRHHRECDRRVGTIGVGRAVRTTPDGYTVSIGNWPSHVVNGAIYALPYDVLKDFEPVARLPSNPYVIVARKDLPASNLKELMPGSRPTRTRRRRERPDPVRDNTSAASTSRMSPEPLQFVPVSRRLLRDYAGTCSPDTSI